MKSRILKYLHILTLFSCLILIFLSKLFISNELFGRSLDYSVPPEPYLMINAFKFAFYTWTDAINAGARNIFGPTLVPANLILYAPLLVRITNPWFIMRYQLFLTLLSSLFFFYLLACQLLKMYSADSREGDREAIAIISSLFFVFNNYFFSDIVFGSNVMTLTYAFLPLVLYFFFRYMQTRKYSNLIWLMLSLLVTSSTVQHFLMAHVFLFLLCLIKRELKLYVGIVLTQILLSMYWILPLLAAAPQIQSGELAQDYTSGLTSSASTFISALINMDYFGNRDMYRLALGTEGLSNIWKINAFIVTCMCIATVAIKNFFSRSAMLLINTFSLILVGSVFFIKGGRAPFGDLVLLLYQKVPVLNVYRSTQHYMGFWVLASSVLFTFLCSYLFLKSRKAFFLILIVVSIQAMPWWLSQDLGTKDISSHKIPSFNMFSLKKGDHILYNLNNEPDEFAVLTVPPGQSVNFISPSGDVVSQGSDMGLLFNNKRTFETEISSGPFQSTMDKLEYDMYTSDTFFQDYHQLLANLNVKYIVIRKDVTPNFSKYYSKFSTKHILASAKKAPYISIVGEYDSIILLKNKDYLPLIHDRINSNSHSNRPAITFKKVNATKYDIHVSGAKNSFDLIFSGTYHEWWKLYPADSTHYVTNSFTNGWKINPKAICNIITCSIEGDGAYSFDLSLEFWPQRLFYIGAGITIISVIILLLNYALRTIDRHEL